MKTEYLYAVIGLLGGIVLAVVFANNAVNTNNQRMMGMMGMRQVSTMQSCSQAGVNQMHDQMMGDGEMTMSGMVNSLEEKTGDEFDKAFIEEMIVHHQGAIDMAESAKENAGHDEIKSMADDIISAQTKEIDQMRQWQKVWNY